MLIGFALVFKISLRAQKKICFFMEIKRRLEGYMEEDVCLHQWCRSTRLSKSILYEIIRYVGIIMIIIMMLSLN